KGPIITFILRILIRFVQAIPDSPLLGLLWPFVRSGLLGFLRRMLSFPVERKVRVSNKMANIIRGGSFDFAWGFLKGLAIGVWEAIIAPFTAIRDLFHLPELIRAFLARLNIRELIAQVRQLLSSLSERAAGTYD